MRAGDNDLNFNPLVQVELIYYATDCKYLTQINHLESLSQYVWPSVACMRLHQQAMVVIQQILLVCGGSREVRS